MVLRAQVNEGLSSGNGNRSAAATRRATRILLLGLVLALGFGGAAWAQSDDASITPEEVADHVGTEQTVCGEVVHATYVPEMDGRPTFLNFGQAWPNQLLSVVIWMSAREEFPEAPETLYREEQVCVTGVIEGTDQGPRIVVEGPDAIVIQEAEEAS